MTNREYFAQNPDKLTGNIMQEARRMYEEKHGYRARMIDPECKILDEFFDAEYRDDKPVHRHETTMIATVQVTKIVRGEMPVSSARNFMDAVVQKIRANLETDDITSVIQVFESDGE